MTSDAEILFEVRGGVGHVLLNRPKALNALTLGMVRELHPQLTAWADDPAIRCVVVEGAGDRAFCAGGDIRALHDWGRAKDRRVIDFYREEYQLNRYIKNYPKPYIAVMGGITMGGGVGLSVHGSIRVATERLVFAMPETGIGLFPDVGGTYFLPRCPGEVGMYLALTGERLKAADAVYAGIADIFVPAEKTGDLVAALANGQNPSDVIAGFAQDPGPAPLRDLQGAIDRHFGKSSVEEILRSLADDGSDWACRMIEIIRAKSPTSTKVAFRQMREGARQDFDACMKLEFRLTNRFMAGHDFYEGVRAVVIDKDQSPNWDPARLEDVSTQMVDTYFESLGADELQF